MKKLLKDIIILIQITIIGVFTYYGYLVYRNYRTVETYRPVVEQVLQEENSSLEADLVLAVILTETKGSESDVMQSTESLDGEGQINNEEASIRQGIALLNQNFQLAQELDVDSWTAVQAYNFGTAYVNYVALHGGVNNVDVAMAYSRDVVATSLGNTSGETYRYHNPVSWYFGKTYLYVNGGNYYYSRLVQINQFYIKLFHSLSL